MRPKWFPPVLVIVATALTNCGAKFVDHEAGRRMVLTSTAFRDGGAIPAAYTCDGAGRAPELSWGEPPTGTRSFAFFADDPDARSGTFHHWGVYDIRASARSIGGTTRVGTEVTNDFGKPGYGGPCPPRGHRPHHYHFKLFALDIDKLGLGTSASVSDVERAASGHTVAEGDLIGTYERK